MAHTALPNILGASLYNSLVVIGILLVLLWIATLVKRWLSLYDEARARRAGRVLQVPAGFLINYVSNFSREHLQFILGRQNTEATCPVQPVVLPFNVSLAGPSRLLVEEGQRLLLKGTATGTGTGTAASASATASATASSAAAASPPTLRLKLTTSSPVFVSVAWGPHVGAVEAVHRRGVAGIAAFHAGGGVPALQHATEQLWGPQAMQPQAQAQAQQRPGAIAAAAMAAASRSASASGLRSRVLTSHNASAGGGGNGAAGRTVIELTQYNHGSQLRYGSEDPGGGGGSGSATSLEEEEAEPPAGHLFLPSDAIQLDAPMFYDGPAHTGRHNHVPPQRVVEVAIPIPTNEALTLARDGRFFAAVLVGPAELPGRAASAAANGVNGVNGGHAALTGNGLVPKPPSALSPRRPSRIAVDMSSGSGSTGASQVAAVMLLVELRQAEVAEAVPAPAAAAAGGGDADENPDTGGGDGGGGNGSSGGGGGGGGAGREAPVTSPTANEPHCAVVAETLAVMWDRSYSVREVYRAGHADAASASASGSGSGGGSAAQSAAAAATGAGAGAGAGAGEEEGDGGAEGEDNLCVVCLTEPSAVILLPCRHLVVCAACHAHITACPVCRTKSTEYMLLHK